MWLYLEKDQRPPEAHAQWASSTILRDTYLTFAFWTSAIAIAMWVLALFFALIGKRHQQLLDAGVVESKIEPAECRQCPFDHCFDITLFRDVGFDEDRFAA